MDIQNENPENNSELRNERGKILVDPGKILKRINQLTDEMNVFDYIYTIIKHFQIPDKMSGKTTYLQTTPHMLTKFFWGRIYVSMEIGTNYSSTNQTNFLYGLIQSILEKNQPKFEIISKNLVEITEELNTISLDEIFHSKDGSRFFGSKERLAQIISLKRELEKIPTPSHVLSCIKNENVNFRKCKKRWLSLPGFYVIPDDLTSFSDQSVIISTTLCSFYDNTDENWCKYWDMITGGMSFSNHTPRRSDLLNIENETQILKKMPHLRVVEISHDQDEIYFRNLKNGADSPIQSTRMVSSTRDIGYRCNFDFAQNENENYLVLQGIKWTFQHFPIVLFKVPLGIQNISEYFWTNTSDVCRKYMWFDIEYILRFNKPKMKTTLSNTFAKSNLEEKNDSDIIRKTEYRIPIGTAVLTFWYIQHFEHTFNNFYMNELTNSRLAFDLGRQLLIVYNIEKTKLDMPYTKKAIKSVLGHLECALHVCSDSIGDDKWFLSIDTRKVKLPIMNDMGIVYEHTIEEIIESMNKNTMFRFSNEETPMTLAKILLYLNNLFRIIHELISVDFFLLAELIFIIHISYASFTIQQQTGIAILASDLYNTNGKYISSTRTCGDLINCVTLRDKYFFFCKNIYLGIDWFPYCCSIDNSHSFSAMSLLVSHSLKEYENNSISKTNSICKFFDNFFIQSEHFLYRNRFTRKSLTEQNYCLFINKKLFDANVVLSQKYLGITPVHILHYLSYFSGTLETICPKNLKKVSSFCVIPGNLISTSPEYANENSREEGKLRLLKTYNSGYYIENETYMSFDAMVMQPDYMIGFIRVLSKCYQKGIVPCAGILLSELSKQLIHYENHAIIHWITEYENGKCQTSFWDYYFFEHNDDVFLRRSCSIMTTGFCNSKKTIDFDKLIRDSGTYIFLGILPDPEEQELLFCRIFLYLLKSSIIHAKLSQPARDYYKYKNKTNDQLFDDSTEEIFGQDQDFFVEAIYHPVIVVLHAFLKYRINYLKSRKLEMIIEKSRKLKDTKLWKPWIRFSKFLDMYTKDSTYDHVYAAKSGFTNIEDKNLDVYPNVLVNSVGYMIRAIRKANSSDSDRRNISFSIPLHNATRWDKQQFVLCVLESFTENLLELFASKRHPSKYSHFSVENLKQYRDDIIWKFTQSNYRVKTSMDEEENFTDGDGPFREIFHTFFEIIRNPEHGFFSRVRTLSGTIYLIPESSIPMEYISGLALIVYLCFYRKIPAILPIHPFCFNLHSTLLEDDVKNLHGGVKEKRMLHGIVNQDKIHFYRGNVLECLYENILFQSDPEWLKNGFDAVKDTNTHLNALFYVDKKTLKDAWDISRMEYGMEMESPYMNYRRMTTENVDFFTQWDIQFTRFLYILMGIERRLKSPIENRTCLYSITNVPVITWTNRITKDILKKYLSLNPHIEWVNAGAISMAFFDWIESLSNSQVEQFIRFATASDVLSGPIVIMLYGENILPIEKRNELLPISQTCTSTVRIPHYNTGIGIQDYEIVKNLLFSGLKIALEHCSLQFTLH